jgi:flagellar basal body-associated protein FliL
MADTIDPQQTKDQDELAELSLDQLDSLISSEDPTFAADLALINALPNDANVNLDVVDIGQNFSLMRENPWRHTHGLRKVVVTLLPFLPPLWDLYYRFTDSIYFFRSRFKVYLKQAGPMLLQGLKTAGKAALAFVKERATTFKNLSTKLKLLAVGLTLAVILTLAFVYRSVTHGILPPDKEFLIASMGEWSEQDYKYDADSEMDSFYDSPRTIQNIMALPKMVVNLKPSTNSGPNPMAAMEFYLEGMSPESIVEVKDRESEVRDLFQRTLEDMSFDDVDIAEGKQLMTERLRQALNGVLTKGKVRRVFIKESVIKP